MLAARNPFDSIVMRRCATLHTHADLILGIIPFSLSLCAQPRVLWNGAISYFPCPTGPD